MADEERASFGACLRSLRESRMLSRSEIATALHVDITTVRGWENDRYRPRPPKLNTLAKLLAISPKQLQPVGSARAPFQTTRLVDTLSELPDLLDQLLDRTTKLLKALRIAAPYSTPANVQHSFRSTLDARLRAGTIEVQRIEIIYTLNRLKEVISNIIRYDGCAYHYKAYCVGLQEVSPAMGGYFFDDEDFLLGAYWTGVPPQGRPGLHLSGEPFRTYFSEYWSEIWRRGTHLNGRGAHDLSACHKVALQLGLPTKSWSSFVKQARAFKVGDGAPPLI